MAIADIEKYFTVISEWDNCIDSVNNMVNFANSCLLYMQVILADQNFIANASVQESQYINSLQTFIQNFVAQIPSNPSK
jgi:hypothetical protein